MTWSLPSPFPTTNSTTEELVILKWLRENIETPRLPKQKHLYIHGPPDTGKSALVEFLRQRLRIYSVPNEPYFDFYSDVDFELGVADEFVQTTIPRNILTQLLDGYSTTLRVKLAQVQKEKAMPFIFLSNFSLEELYKGVDLAAMLSRFTVVQLTEKNNIADFRLRYYFPVLQLLV